VDRAHEVVCRRREDDERVRVVVLEREAREEQETAGWVMEPYWPSISTTALPLVEPVGRNHAAGFLKGLAERAQCGCGLAACVDDEAPAVGLHAEPRRDDAHHTILNLQHRMSVRGRDIPARPVQARGFGAEFRDELMYEFVEVGCGQGEPSAHAVPTIHRDVSRLA
jgi:hypothetical protein